MCVLYRVYNKIPKKKMLCADMFLRYKMIARRTDVRMLLLLDLLLYSAPVCPRNLIIADRGINIIAHGISVNEIFLTRFTANCWPGMLCARARPRAIS